MKEWEVKILSQGKKDGTYWKHVLDYIISKQTKALQHDICLQNCKYIPAGIFDPCYSFIACFQTKNRLSFFMTLGLFQHPVSKCIAKKS